MNGQAVIDHDWTYLLMEGGQDQLLAALRDYLPRCRWFQSKAREVRQIAVVDVVPMVSLPTRLVFLAVEYTSGTEETYLLPVQFVREQDAAGIIQAHPIAAIMRVRCREEGEMADGLLIDAVYDEGFREGVLNSFAAHPRMNGEAGWVEAATTSAFRQLHDAQRSQPARLLGREQSNTSIRYGGSLVLKLMRKLEEGVNPELEIGRFLTEETRIRHVPLLAGYMEYRRATHAPVTLAVLQNFVQNQGDAWEYTLDWLADWFRSGILEQAAPRLAAEESFVLLAQQPLPDHARAHLAGYLDQARLLGQRTAELHVALASGTDDRFRPVEFSLNYQQELYVSIISMADRIFTLLRQRLQTLPQTVAAQARAVLDHEAEIRETFRLLEERAIPGKRIRGHGDYHLGQVLVASGDFVIVDFEGEPARPLAERYIRHSPLRDVAGMLRSFHYAAYGILPGFGPQTPVPEQHLAQAEPWARYWRSWVSVAFLQGYFEHVAPAAILPPTPAEVDTLLRILIMEKAIYELGYEINNRPGWLKVPAQAITRNVQ